MNLVEIHVIQPVPPANLNRDDTGSPKDTVFGGVRRARISSQAQKRAVRVFFNSYSHLEPEERAVRTRLLLDELVKMEEFRDFPEEERKAVIRAALRALDIEVDNQGRTEYLLFLGREEIEKLAEGIKNHWGCLVEVAKLAREEEQKAAQAQAGEKRSPKRKKRGLEEEVWEEVRKRAGDKVDKLKKAFQAILDGGKAVDIALFGRMLADRPELGKDAACQVAHAISTHRVDREFDFYTAVDDLQPREQSGAGMMGDVEYYSATFYRYANINLDQLMRNLQGDNQGDRELAKKAVEAFIRGFVLTLPSGKQNTFAAHSLPEFVAILVRKDSMPRNLAAAFEKPVYPSDGKDITERSVEELLKYWKKLDNAYGKPAREEVAIVCLPEVDLPYHRDKRVDTLDEALERANKTVDELLNAVHNLLGGE
mgnify:CR=1 FL=1